MNNTDELPNEPQNGEVLVQYSDESAYKTALDNFNLELDEAIKISAESVDWRELRKQFVEMRDKLKSLFLNDDDSEMLNEKLRIALENVNHRQTEEQEKLEIDSQTNYDSVIQIVKDSVVFAETSIEYKQAREKLLAAQDKFKNLRMKRLHKDELYKLINDAFDIVSRKQNEDRENYEMECIDNYHNLKNKIDVAIQFANSSEIFAESRNALIAVQGLIKGLKLKREQRDELYQLIRDAFDGVNTRQEAERKNFELSTSENFEKLKVAVSEAIAFAKVSEDFGLSREKLINAQNQIKSAKLRREQRDELFGEIRAVFEDLNERQSTERAAYESDCVINYDKLTEKVNDCFGLVHGTNEFNIIREALITVQGEVRIARLKKDQRNEMFSRIREAFSLFDKKKNEYYDLRKEEKSKKMADVKVNLEDKINRWEDVLAKDLESLEIQNAKLNASDIDEFLVGEIKTKITNIEARIKEKQELILQAKSKIAEIDSESE